MIRPKEYALSGYLEAQARAWHEEMDRGVFGDRHVEMISAVDHLFGKGLGRAIPQIICAAVNWPYRRYLKSAPNP